MSILLIIGAKEAPIIGASGNLVINLPLLLTAVIKIKGVVVGFGNFAWAPDSQKY